MNFLATVTGIRIRMPKEFGLEVRVAIALECQADEIDLEEFASLARGPLILEVRAAQLAIPWTAETSVKVGEEKK